MPIVTKPQTPSWPMAGANPQRTSWTAEEVRGNLKPIWYRPIEPYILPRVQVVADNKTLFISTARGLYALDAATGADKWIYPTEMPLGHSPTIEDGVAYVGGFDRRLHAVDAETGKGLWKFEAGAGFDTNPLVVGDKVYVGNRDGIFYAIYAKGPKTGQLAWKYETQGPIHFSAAYQNGAIYFASDDSHAYALNAQTGQLIWRSAKLPGSGFHSWWPVVYRDFVIFAGSSNYYNELSLGPGSFRNLDRDEIYPNKDTDPIGTLVGPLGTAAGDWVGGTPTIDTSKPTATSNGKTKPITEYFEDKPWRRTYLVLNRFTGKEYSSDFDHDGKTEYAPILWVGTHGAGNRFPPIVGGDGVLYQTNNYMSNSAIAGGQVSGWQVGTPFISIISSDWGAVDEPHAYSAGGNYLYWNLCCDRQFEAIDLTKPNKSFVNRYNAGIRPPTGHPDPNREWGFFSYNLPDLIPGYNIMTYVFESKYSSPYGGVYGGQNGSYGWHGDGNPPIPYNGMVYMHRSNAVIAFGPQSGDPTRLPVAKVVTKQDNITPIDGTELRARLADEVQKIMDAGHLRPGYLSSGLFDIKGKNCGEGLVEYWHHPGDTLYTLIRALPHLPPDLQQQTRTFLQSEFTTFPPYQYNHIGWNNGSSREPFEVPPDAASVLLGRDPESNNVGFPGWNLAPHSFYAMWKYAEIYSNEAQSIFDASKHRLESPPSDAILKEMPHVHNAYIAGYIGYLELEKLAGYPESTNVRAELNRLLALRVATFSKDAPDVFLTDSTKYYCRSLNVARNFIYLVPELGQYLNDNAYTKVQESLEEYEDIAPYWFVGKAELAFAEAVITPYYDAHALFQAKALIMNESRDSLTKFLDVPAFEVGDLFYIQNLVAAIEAGNK